MKIYLATWLEEINQAESLSKQKKKERLLSFFFFLKRKHIKKELAQYVKTGTFIKY